MLANAQEEMRADLGWVKKELYLLQVSWQQGLNEMQYRKALDILQFVLGQGSVKNGAAKSLEPVAGFLAGG